MKIKSAIVCIAVLVSQPVAASCIVGKIVGVYDGDTVTMLDTEKKQHKLRLAEIDAPELKQAYGQTAKQELSDIVYGRTCDAKVMDKDKDRYGREVAILTCDGVNANYAMVERGAAWAYREYAKSEYVIILENRAREAMVGIWSLREDQQVRPQDYRKKKK